MEAHTGGSRSTPTVHPCSQSGRRLWVAQQAPHQKSPNGEVNTAQSQHGSGARNVPQPGASQLSNEERNDDLSSTVTAETPWQCKLEFSTDKIVANNKILTARCRWNRTVSVSAECQETLKDLVVS